MEALEHEAQQQIDEKACLQKLADEVSFEQETFAEDGLCWNSSHILSNLVSPPGKKEPRAITR